MHTRSSKDSTFIHIEGEKYIYENLCGFNFRISPDSFFQINTSAAYVLYDELFKLMNPIKTSTLLDLCCGTGLMNTYDISVFIHVNTILKLGCIFLRLYKYNR